MSAFRNVHGNRTAQLLIVIAGLVCGQALLYGPSLCGRKVLLPLDILASPNVYLPRTPETAAIRPQNNDASDLLYFCEPARRFAVSEFRAGRLPMWTPFQFAGAPFIWPKFSPFLAVQNWSESPVLLAWTQLAAALVGGLGAHLFFRRVLAVGFWPAAIAAWCFPLTGFVVLWQGCPTALPVYWLPWILLAVANTARRTSQFAPLWLAVVTCLVLVSGHLDVAGQVLLVSGLFAIWCLVDKWRHEWLGRQPRWAAMGLIAGWGLGLLLAAPYELPVLEYTQTGARMTRRSVGGEERPPVGLAALPETVLPDIYGSPALGSMTIFPKRQSALQESASGAYAGVLAALWLAPLAWSSRRHRSLNVFWSVLLIVALSWCLDLPGIVSLLRLPVLKMMSHNRLVFAASFAVLAMSAVGLEVLAQGPVRWRWWHCLAPALLAALCAWSVYRSVVLPEQIGEKLEQSVLQGFRSKWVHDLEDVSHIQSWFVRHYAAAAVWCALGIGGWWAVWRRHAWQHCLLPVAAILLAGDLLWFAHGRYVQCDPALYFPTIPVLKQVATAAPGRVIGYNCLPAALAQACSLRDVRGYDAVDPARIIDLLALARDPRSQTPNYAYSQYLTPKAVPAPDGSIRLSPLLDMLGVRYVIFRGSPPAGMRPVFQGPDYWVQLNAAALPRAFVPHRIETVTETGACLVKLGAPAFDPREIAYTEVPVDVPALCAGTAGIVEDIPTRVTLGLQMQTPGVVVLADLWDKGWRAYLNGRPAPILPVNRALRGVVAPAGSGTLVFRYEPAGFAWGLRLSTVAGSVLAVWFLCAYKRSRSEALSLFPAE